MRRIKLEVLFRVHDSCFNGNILKHYTTVERLCSGVDDFDYKNADIIAKRQFTGLTDKNGVEIYEGDIVENDFYMPEISCSCEVKYSNGLARFVFDDSEQDAYEYGLLTVIGNIHENKELLNA